MDKSLILFLDSLKRPATRKEYQKQLKAFIDYHNIPDFDSLLVITEEKLEEMVQTYMSYLENTRKLEYNSCHLAVRITRFL